MNVTVLLFPDLMNAEVLDELNALSKAQDEWKCSLLIDGVEKTDLVTRLTPNETVQKILQKNHNFPSKTWYMFPSLYNGINGRQLLIKTIREAVVDGGFALNVAKRYDLVLLLTFSTTS